MRHNSNAGIVLAVRIVTGGLLTIAGLVAYSIIVAFWP
jgi:hypothetical protein